MVANEVVQPYCRRLETMRPHRVGIRQVHQTGDFDGGRQEACYWYARFLLDAARAIDRQIHVVDNLSTQAVINTVLSLTFPDCSPSSDVGATILP